MSLFDYQVPLYDIPVGKPPPGVHSNFIDPPSLEAVSLTISVVMTTLALLFVIVRLYANSRLPRGLAIDDCKICTLYHGFQHLIKLDFCIIATVLSIAHTGVVLSCK